MFLRVVERFYTVPQGIELVGRELAVDRAPGDGAGGGRLINDEAIDWRTLLACVMRFPVGQWPSAPNVFVVESRALLPRKKWAGLCQKSPKRVGPSCRNGVNPADASEFTCAEPF
jgi:hypothetical protein